MIGVKKKKNVILVTSAYSNRGYHFFKVNRQEVIWALLQQHLTRVLRAGGR